jgi:2-isopropylmalate synthase
VVNVALNLYTQGIHPGLDLSDIDAIRAVVEHGNKLPVHPRHPYVGDLVYTSFSGSHQDAIKKAFDARDEADVWDMPYLLVDPHDLGRSYQAVIRVNSQSGKGGIAYLLEADYGMKLPRRAQIEFSQSVQSVMDEEGAELTAGAIWDIFSREYLNRAGPFVRQREAIDDTHGKNHIEVVARLSVSGQVVDSRGSGATEAHAFADAVTLAGPRSLSVVDVVHHAGVGPHEGTVACYVELRDGEDAPRFGVGLEATILDASCAAVVSALNRAA